MDSRVEHLVTELNDISAALEFIGVAIECYDSEGKEFNKCGVAYLTRMLGRRSSKAAERCWGLGGDSFGVGKEDES